MTLDVAGLGRLQRASTVPADKYKLLRDFFGRIRAVEDSPVVLARK